MKVLLLGATGYIGQAILSELLNGNGHEVVALVRTEATAQKVSETGAMPLLGDINSPEKWVSILQDVDAIVHVAATFLDDMGDVDRKLIEVLIEESQKLNHPIRMVYTGGCWLFGDTAGQVLDETASFNSISAFQWMIDNWALLCSAPNIKSILIHPAMVYDKDGGAFGRFIEAAETKKQIEVWGALDIHWPLVHRIDLAKAYCLALENASSGSEYIVTGEGAVSLHAIVERISERFELSQPPYVRGISEVVAEQGDWALGPALNQKLTSKKIEDELGWRPKFTDALSLLL